MFSRSNDLQGQFKITSQDQFFRTNNYLAKRGSHYQGNGWIDVGDFNIPYSNQVNQTMWFEATQGSQATESWSIMGWIKVEENGSSADLRVTPRNFPAPKRYVNLTRDQAREGIVALEQAMQENRDVFLIDPCELPKQDQAFILTGLNEGPASP